MKISERVHIIRPSQQAPEIREQIANIVHERRNRYCESKERGLKYGSIFGTLGAIALNQPAMILNGVFITTPIIGSLEWKRHSPKVRDENIKLGNLAKSIDKLDIEGKFSWKEHIESGKYVALVDLDGALQLVKKSIFEKALFKAQNTFLKHITPAIYRVRTK